MLRGVLRVVEGPALAFWCEGCGCAHVIDVETRTQKGWTFDGDYDRPTFKPSILVTYRHPKGHTNDNPAPMGYDGEYVEDVCHSWVTKGVIQYLADCSHALRGQSVPLQPFSNEKSWGRP